MRTWAVLALGLMGCGGPPECDLEPEPGDCPATFTRYYYDAGTDSCLEFTWSGCDGVVPFETFLECQQACVL